MTDPKPWRPQMTRREHDLKTWPSAFVAVRDGLKPWELRKNDRGYQVGDLLQAARAFLAKLKEQG